MIDRIPLSDEDLDVLDMDLDYEDDDYGYDDDLDDVRSLDFNTDYDREYEKDPWQDQDMEVNDDYEGS